MMTKRKLYGENYFDIQLHRQFNHASTMRGQRDICLLCRHALKRPPPSASARRWLSSPADEPYVLPRVVIDLDDADSKFVRKLEDMPEKQRLKQLGVETIKVKNPNFKRIQMLKRQRGFDQLNPKISLKTQGITPTDLLQYALLGDPWGYTTGIAWLRLIFKRRGIQIQDDEATKVQQLTHDFTTDASKTLKAAGFQQDDHGNIRTGLLRQQTFLSLARQLTMLSTTDEGCHFLASNGMLVYNAIRKCRMHGFDRQKSGPVSVVRISEVLEMLNNLTRNMMGRGVDIGDGIYNAGLYYASKASILPAIKMYLEIGLRHNYHAYQGFEFALRNLQLEYATGISPPTRWAAWKEHGERREELLKLITGWNSSGRSFRELIFTSKHPDPETQRSAYRRYILGIGEMGFSDALWEEWQSQPAVLAISREGLQAQLFAMAFVLAKDRDRALEVLESFAKPPLHRSPDSISQAELFFKQYSFHHLESSRTLTKMIKDDVPRDPQSALEFYERLLVVDYPKFIADTRFTLRWETKDEKEGLLVMPQEGQDPIYWKPTETVLHTEIEKPSDEEYPV
jgi:hypothetical protein